MEDGGAVSGGGREADEADAERRDPEAATRDGSGKDSRSVFNPLYSSKSRQQVKRKYTK